MDTRVDDEADRAPHLVGELSEFAVGISVQSELTAQALTVEPPPLDKCGVAAKAAKFGNAFELLPQRDLQVMSRDGLVERQRFHLPPRPRWQVVGVDEIRPRAMRERTAGLIIRRRLRALCIWGNRAHAVRQAREGTEQTHELGIDPLREIP